MDLYADPPGCLAEEAARFTSALGGSAANIAAGIVRLGGSASLVTTVSDDAVGRYVCRELSRYGIDLSHVGRAAGDCRTSLAVVETRAENCQSVIYRNGAADFLLSPEQVVGIGMAGYAALIVTGTALAVEPSRAATLLAISQARAADVPVIFDVDYRPYSWVSAADAAAACRMAAEASDMVIGNDVEWDVMAGGPGGLALARDLASNRDAVIYKMGDQPCRPHQFRNAHLSRCGAEAHGCGRCLHGWPRHRACRRTRSCRGRAAGYGGSGHRCDPRWLRACLADFRGTRHIHAR